MDKLTKIKKLADAMYYAAQYLTTDASHLRKAMDEYHKFIIHEYHKEEPVSEELDVIAREYAGIPCDAPKDLTYCVHDKKAKYDAVLFGANWKEQQFEKNRLHHCEALTDEQAKIESDFVTQHLKNNNRTPTFIDAIEYGKGLQKQQMMKGVVEGEVCDGYKYLPYAALIINKNYIKPLKTGDKIKLIIVKEE